MTGAEIKERRRRIGLKQEEIAAGIGVAAATLCRWERGKMRMRARHQVYAERVLATYELHMALARQEVANLATAS